MLKHKKRFVVIISLLLIVATAGGAYAMQSRQSSQRAQETQADATPTTEVSDSDQEEEPSYAPPTQEELDATDRRKEELDSAPAPAPAPAPSPTPAAKRSVTPVISSAGQFDNQVEVRALVPGIYEAGGSCRAVFSGAGNLSRTADALQDATTTRCEAITIPKTAFAAGSWSVRVTYTSASSAGTSQPTRFEVR